MPTIRLHLSDDELADLRWYAEEHGLTVPAAVHHAVAHLGDLDPPVDDSGDPVDVERAIARLGSAAEVARVLDVSAGLVTHWRRGRRRIPAERAQQIRDLVYPRSARARAGGRPARNRQNPLPTS